MPRSSAWLALGRSTKPPSSVAGAVCPRVIQRGEERVAGLVRPLGLAEGLGAAVMADGRVGLQRDGAVGITEGGGEAIQLEVAVGAGVEEDGVLARHGDLVGQRLLGGRPVAQVERERRARSHALIAALRLLRFEPLALFVQEGAHRRGSSCAQRRRRGFEGAKAWRAPRA